MAFTFTLPMTPQDSSSPNCLGMGAIGVLLNSVVLFSAVDARGDDAVAHETGASTVVGWSVDGYPIVVERDATGQLPNNGDLDECHGRTSPILLDGQVVERYHYSATLEYPYTVGCLKAAATT